MKNLLRLHEAIAVALWSQKDRTASFDVIAQLIEKRGLYPNRKGNIPLAKQIQLRAAIASSRYKTLFEFRPPDILKLK